MSTVSVRYIVHDVDAALAFYADALGFDVRMHPGPGFAALERDGMRLNLNAVGGDGGASRAMPDGTVPEPGGWNRFQLVVDDIEEVVARLETAGAPFRSGIIDGNGGRQVLVDDPSGNPVELFQPWPEGS